MIISKQAVEEATRDIELAIKDIVRARLGLSETSRPSPSPGLSPAAPSSAFEVQGQ